jgi:hypothetical protein
MNEYLVITWTDSVPAGDGLAEAARDRGGQLLAAGPVHDAPELDSRPAPAGLVIARFSTEGGRKNLVWCGSRQARRNDLARGRCHLATVATG